VHVVHVSTAAGVDLVRSAGPGTSVTCETAPHYLFLDRGWLEKPNGHRWICTPPLRSKEESEALRQKAIAGSFDAFATDHCAFLKDDKDDWRGDVRRAANGVAGIGALVPLVFRLFSDRSSETMIGIGRRLASNPARIAGLYPRKGTICKGSDADLAIIKESKRPRVIRSSMADVHETYPGFTTDISFRSVFVRGEPVVENDRLVHPGRPRGVWLCRK
jgi:dihydropyrimidinase